MRRLADWLSWLAPAALGLWSHRAWQAIPKPDGWRGVPVHFGADGAADRWSTGYFEPVLLLPILLLLLVAILTFLPTFSALPENARKSVEALRWLKAIVVALIVWLQVGILGAGASGRGDLGGHMLLWLGLLFAGIGLILPGLKRQAFTGIRVPWTLLHDLVWDETHKRAGPLWVGVGLALITLDLAWPAHETWGFGLLMAVVLYSALALPFSIFKRLQREGRLEA